MDIAYRFDCEGVTTTELEGLFRATSLDGRTGEKIRRAFTNSSLVCFAFDGTHLIGASRALTDGEYHALIYDVAVLPEYQRRGVGKRLVAQLLDRLSVWRVMLVADEKVQGFYRKLGFEIYPDVLARLDWGLLHSDQS